MGKVLILLSTYNGEKYLEEQLNSLLRQKDVNLNILVRDDGSTDGTLSILEKFERNHDNIDLIRGGNVGVVKSFFDLLLLGKGQYDFYAFCDQDDIWEEEKIKMAQEKLLSQNENGPLLYCSRTKLVDEKLNFIKYSNKLKYEPILNNALIENVSTGCTMVFNSKLREEVISKNVDLTKIVMHDWWIYLIALLKGKVIFDENSYILYRQHSSNTVGASLSTFAMYKKRIERFLKKDNKGLLEKQARELYNAYSEEIPIDKKLLIEEFLYNRKKVLNRIRQVMKHRYYRQSKIDTVLYYLLVLMGKG